MKKQFIKYFIWVLLFLFINSCGEDVDTYLEPDQALLVNEIELQAAEADASGSFTTPEMSALGLSIVKIYSDGTEKTMTSEEMKSGISWDVLSNSNMSVSQDQETSTLRIQGIGTAKLIASYLPNSDNGNRQISSNALTITTVESKLTGVEVVPVEDYLVDCNNSDRLDTELVVGCLMQFQALAHYDNGLVFDISDTVDWEIIVGDETMACLVSEKDLTSFSSEPWYSVRSNYFATPGNAEKRGLVLGTNVGSFDIKITYNAESSSFEHTSDTVTVDVPDFYTMAAEITIPGGSSCSNNCSLYENISFDIDVGGVYENDAVEEDILSRSSITSTANNDPAIEIEKGAGEYFTGTIRIDYGAPEAITFIISAEGLTRTINATIYDEEILAVKKDFPADDLLLRLSNTDIYFLLDADYNNDLFKIKDGGDYRKKELNTAVFDNWIIQKEEYLAWVDDATWDVNVGRHAKTSDDPTGDARVIATSAEHGSIYWDVIIDNNAANPISLTINPSDKNNETTYTIEGGVNTKFSAMAIFNNETSGELENGQVIWSTDKPAGCTIDLVDAPKVPCIDSYGNLLTYTPLQIIATSEGFQENISTSLDLTITDSNLTGLEISPSRPDIYGKESVQLFVKGIFENGKSHVLPKDCLNWSLDNYGNINNDGILVVEDVSTDVEINVTAKTTEPGCASSSTPGRSINNQEETLRLNIRSLPVISLLSSTASLSEDDPPFNLTFISDATFDADITVPYNVTGSSTSGIDHDLLDGYIVIPAGSISAILSGVNVYADDLDEHNETIMISLMTDGLINARLSDNSTEVVTIVDTNNIPGLDISFDPAGDVSEDVGIITAKFELTGGTVSGRDIPIGFAINDVDSEDFNIPDVSGDTITLPAGQNSTTLDIEVVYNTSKENSESMNVTFDVSSDLASVIGGTSYDIRIDDVDSLQFLDQINEQECTIDRSCTINLPGLNNEGPVVNVTLTGPTWAWINPEQTQIEVDTSSVNSAFFMVCASDASDPSDEACLPHFYITVKP